MAGRRHTGSRCRVAGMKLCLAKILPAQENQQVGRASTRCNLLCTWLMFCLWLGLLPRAFRARRDLLIENLALRQQLAVLKRKHPRPRLTAFDRSFWLLASRFWSSWKQSLIFVSPDTVVRWHRAEFRWYWSMLTKIRENRGRKRISKGIRALILRMAAENPSWGAPRIHGELLMLGFDVSERTVSRWMRRSPRNQRRLRSGEHSFATTAKRFLRWTSLPCQL